MNQLLIGIILVLSLGGYWLYQENVTLKANNIALEGAIATQEEAMKTMQNDFALQTTQLTELQKEQFNLRFQAAGGQLENTARVQVVRRDIARIKTLMNDRQRAAQATTA